MTRETQLRPLLWTGVAVLGLLVLWLFCRTHDSRPIVSALPHEIQNTDSAHPAERTRPDPANYAREPRLAAETRPGVNGVTFWNSAHEKLRELTPREQDILARRGDAPTEAEITALMAKLVPIVGLVQRGAASEYQDWGWQSPTGALQLTQTPVELARMLTWHAEHLQNEPAQVIADLTIAQQLGDSMAPYAAIGKMFQSVVDTLVTKSIARLASEEPLSFSPQLEALLNSSIGAQRLADSLRSEAANMRKVIEAMSPSQRLDQAQLDHPEATSATAGKLLENQIALWDRAAEQTDSPDRFAQFLQTEKATAGPMQAQNLRIMKSFYESHRAVAVERALVAAGLAWQNGTALNQLPMEPFAGRPFTATVTESGMRLTASLERKDKPISHEFASPKTTSSD